MAANAPASPATRLQRLRMQATLLAGGAFTTFRKRAQPLAGAYATFRKRTQPLEQWVGSWFSGSKRVQPRRAQGAPGVAINGGYVVDNETDDDLVGREKYRTYSRLLANVSVVGASVRYFLNLCAKATWTLEPAEHARGKEYAELVEQMLMEDPDTPWGRIVRRAAMYRFYGFSVQEWVARRRDDGLLTFADVAPRPQLTIERWDVNTDGSVNGIAQRSPQTQDELYLPRGKVVYLVDDSLHDSPEGLGLFRNIVAAATRLERYEQLEGLGYETDLRGIPVGRAPYGELQDAVRAGSLDVTDAQKAVAPLERFISDRVRNDAPPGIVLDSAVYESEDDAETPSGNPKYSMELLDAGVTSLSEVPGSIERLKREIANVLGTDVLLLGAGDRGSYALSTDKTQQLSMQVDATLQDLAQAFERDLIKVLFRLNGWPLEAMPKLVPEAAQYRDPEQQAAILQSLAAAGHMVDGNDPAVAEIRANAGLSAPEPLFGELDAGLLGASSARPQPPQTPLEEGALEPEEELA